MNENKQIGKIYEFECAAYGCKTKFKHIYEKNMFLYICPKCIKEANRICLLLNNKFYYLMRNIKIFLTNLLKYK